MIRAGVVALESPLQTGAGFLQLVRWRRKPRWLPVAKSKMFRVPERKEQDPVERAELMQLHAHYKTQLRAVRGFLIRETQEREATSTADHLIFSPEEVDEEFRKCSEVNDQWNAEIAIIRNRRLDLERETQRGLILERLQALEERTEARRTLAEEQVRAEKERVKTLITPETIDQAIEVALANPVDFDYAIDLGGNILRDEHK